MDAIYAAPFYKTVNGANIAGFQLTHPDGREEYVYLCPDTNTDDPEGPCVFLYQGTEADPAQDEAQFYHVLTEEQAG